MPPVDDRAPSEPGALAERTSLLDRFRSRDHTRGSLYASLLVLALPSVATSLFGGVLFQIGDLKLISGLGEDAMTAVIITNQTLRQIYIMMVMGASFGTQGLIARAIGTGDQESADHVAGQILVMGAMLSGVMAFLGLAFPGQMLGAMNVSDEVLAIGVPYVRLVFLLNFGFVFVFVANGILGGAGDTATPFFVSIVQAMVGLLGEYCLIYGNLGFPELGIRGVALGLSCGHLVSCLLIARVIFGGKSRIHLRLRHLRPDRKAMTRILGLSWPPAIQMIASFVVTIFFVRLMGDFGDKAQAAYSIGLRLGLIGPMIAFPLAGACATLIGQNLGAGQIGRAWKSLWVGLSVHATLLISLGVALFFYRVELLELFTQDPEVIAIGDEMLFYQAISFLFFAFYFVFFRALQGAGDVMVPMLFSVGNSLLVSVPLGFYLSLNMGYGPSGVFITGLVSSIIVTLATGCWLATGRWTRRARRAP